MIKKNAFIPLILLLCFNPAWANVADAPWPMLQHDIFHQGFSTDYGPNLNFAALTFSCDVEAEGTATAVIDRDGTAYIGSKNGCLYKVYTDGTRESIYKDIEGSVTASAALADDGTLYIGSTAGKLYALSTDGELKWVFTTPGEPIFSSPAIGPGGMIFFGTGPLQYAEPGALYCITPSGNQLWSYSTGAVGSSSPAIDRYGNIYICTYDGKVHAVSGSGTPLWIYPDNDNLNFSITSSPMLAQDGAVYITNSSALIALDFDLSFKWQFIPTSKALGLDMESGIIGSPTMLPNGNIIIGGMLGDIHCLDSDGKELWSRVINKQSLLPAAIRSSPIIDKNGTIYVRSQNLIYALDPSQGSITSKIRLEYNQQDAESDFDGSPVLGTRRMLYMCSNDGKLYALGPDRRRACISGAIAGNIPATGMKIQVYTDAGIIQNQKPEMYEAPVEADGSYIVPDIYPGIYVATPICQNPFIAVEPSSRKVFLLLGQHKTGIDFTIPPPDTSQHPYISMAEASPNPVILPEQHLLHVDARILAATPVIWTLDLAALGSLPDNASIQTPDPAQATCSWDIDLTGTDILGSRVLMVSATDANGKVAHRPVLVDFQHHTIQELDNGSTGDFSENITEQPFEGYIFKILFKYSSLAADTSPKHMAAGTEKSAVSGIVQVLLRIFSPSNTTGIPDYEIPVTDQQQELQINNAEKGAWGITVTNNTDTNVQCDLTSTIAGTGIVFGAVVDAESHAPVNGNIQTSLGTSAPTEDGVYVLLSPSGVFNLTASPPKYLPTTKSVSLNAGSSVEKNISLIPGNFSDNATTCCATAVLGHAPEKLDLLRQFRDSCLKKTPLGMAYSKKYYRFSPEITAMITADPALRAQAQETLEAVLPLIQALLGKNMVEHRALPDERIQSCLKAFRSTASQELASEIDKAMKLLAAKRFFDLIGLAR